MRVSPKDETSFCVRYCSRIGDESGDERLNRDENETTKNGNDEIDVKMSSS
jgi:hypothetical protein